MADTEQDHCNVNNQQDSDSEQEETSESSEEPQEESLQGEDIQPPGKTGEQRKKQPPGDLLERATSGGATGRTQSAEERGEVNGERQPQEESPQEEDKQPLGETGEGGKQQHLGDLLEGATSRGTTGRTQSEQRGESSSEQLQSVEGGKEQPPGKTGEGGQPAVGGVEQPPGETAEGGEEQPPGDVLDVAASRGTAGRKLAEERGEVNGERQPQEESPQEEDKQPLGETGEGGKQQHLGDLLEGATSRGTTGRTQSALHLVKSREVYSQEKIMDQDNYKPKIVAGRLKTLPNYSAPLPESLRTTCVGEYLENCGNYSGYMQDSSSSSGGADSSSVKELEPRRRKKIQKRIQKRNARHSKAPSSAALSCDVVQSACSQQQVKVTPDNYPSNITVHAENVVIGDSTELNILRQRPPGNLSLNLSGIGRFDITIDPPEISLKLSDLKM
ncbi:collagen alpha-1(XI) chain-like [Stylophora pistillata]|uniref:collagen alpha-1(XI) chain-like n=1 Tax=Stylophora pistillata TaxID=50429 RepID=UPI000C0565EE|nr:collagen alpha-1(XI) chain-like [Stylophora pistillata]